jgi:hypothetical protein
MLGGGPRQWPDNLAWRYHLHRPFLEEVLKHERPEERYRPPAVVGLMVPAHRHVVERSDPASGKPQIDIVLVFAELLGTIEELALLLFNPPGLRDHPFRRDRP